MAEDKEKISVTFFTVSDSYPPSKDLTVGFKCPSGLQVSSSDWVGIFKVGWVSTRDYYTFEWVNWTSPVEEETQKVGSVTFAGRRIPPSDGSMYQFCYVGKGYALKGCSRPFVISAEATDVGLVDAEFVEITNDDVDQLRSMVVINTTPSNKKGGVPASVLEMKEKVAKITEENDKITKEKDELTKQLEAANQKVAELQEELEAKKKGFDVLQEKTEGIKKKAQENNTLLNETISNLKEEKTVVLQQLSEISTKLEEENATLKTSLDKLEEDCSGLQLELEKTKANLDSTYEELKTSETARADLVTSKLMMEQEIKTIKENTVSKDAFAALQKAQQSIQQSGPLESIAIISEKEMLEARNEELVAKLNMCKEEFTQKCYEIRDLQKQMTAMKVSSQAPSNSNEAIDSVMEELESRREKCKELEEKNSAFEEMNSLLEEKVMSNERVISGLKDEMEDKIEQLTKDRDEEIALLNQQIIQQTEELASIRETNATKEQQKSNAIASLTAQLGEKDKEIAVLKAAPTQPINPTPQQYPPPHNTSTHRPSRNQPPPPQSRPPVVHASTGKPTSKECPVCQVKFPLSVTNPEFEVHVQSHFDY